MDYEKVYNEALERARKFMSEHPTRAEADLMAAIFPELRESGDERIRKGLVYHLQELREWKVGEMVPIKTTKHYDAWIAYLEKQKVNTEGDFARGYDCGYECCLNSHGAEWFEKQKKPIPIPNKFNGLKSLMLRYLQSAANRKNDTEIESDTDLYGRKILDYVWKYDGTQKEQKPIEESGTAEPDYGICDDYIPASLHHALKRHGWYAGHVGEEEEFVLQRRKYVERNWPADKNNLTQEQKKQKPVYLDLDNASQDYVYNHFCSGADFTPEYIKGLMEDAFVNGANWHREQTDGKAMLHVAEKSYQIGLRDGRMGQKPDKCNGCNNVKGCITCVNGDQWAHIEEEPANGDSEKPNNQWSEDFEENIRALLHDKLTWRSEDGGMSSTVLIDDKTLKDIISGIWFYVSKEALKYPNKELNVIGKEDK